MNSSGKNRVWVTVLLALLAALMVSLTGPFLAQEPADPGDLGPYATNYVTETVTNPDTGDEIGFDIYFPASDGEVDPSGAPYSALVFAHGLMAPRAANSGNAEHLASWGNIVLLPDLPNDLETRYSDVVYVLDYLLEQNADSNSIFYQTVDTDRLSITGHSLGGASTWMLSARDERIKRAAIPLDAVVPPAFGGSETWDFAAEVPDISAPIALIVAPSHMCNSNAQYNEVFPLVGSTHKVKITIEGANHCDFLDPEDISQADTCTMLCGGEYSPDRLRVIEQWSAAWLNYYMQLDTDYYTYLYGDRADQDVQDGKVSLEVHTAPKDVDAATASEGVEVTWTLYDHPIIAGYNIYRSQQSGDYPDTPYAQVGRTSSYLDTNVVGGQRYYYIVRSRDAAGNEHQPSDEVSATFQGTAPSAPILVAPPNGIVTTTQTITFTWQAGPGSFPEGYNLDLDGAVITTTDTFSSAVLALGVHTWTVRAYEDSLYSPWASPAWTVEVSDTLPAPGVPVLVAPPDGTITTTQDITFAWRPSAGGAPQGYNFRLDAEVMTTTRAAWPELVDVGSHTWTVRAFNDGGTSAWTAPWSLEVRQLYPIYVPLVTQ